VQNNISKTHIGLTHKYDDCYSCSLHLSDW